MPAPGESPNLSCNIPMKRLFSKHPASPTMTRLTFILLCLSGLALATPPLAPHTPEDDLRGSWDAEIDPTLPNVLILGDSISIAYTRPVRRHLEGEANILRPMRPDGRGPDNCGDTTIGLANIERYLGDMQWDVIHFNWGLWDLCYRNPEARNQGNRDKKNGTVSTTPDAYESQLEKLVERLQQSNAKLIWASTTLVPEGEPGRFVGDDKKYNAIAARVMQRHNIPINDLHTLTTGFPANHFVGPGDVHFTAAGSAKLAEQVAAKIRTMLAGGNSQQP